MRILDIGRNFGMPGFHVYSPWNPEEVQVDSIKTAAIVMPTIDLVIFGGGADIHPHLYGHANVASGCSKTPSYRDMFEQEIWKLAQEHEVPLVGLCRGAQLACAMSGGSLIQHVENHGGGQHKIETIDHRDMYITTVHHQMMYPFDVTHELIAWTLPRSARYIVDKNKLKLSKGLEKEPEIVFFPKTRALAIQGHPEFYDDPEAAPVRYTRELTAKYLKVNFPLVTMEPA